MAVLLRDRPHGPIPSALFTGVSGAPAGDIPFRYQVAIGTHPYIIDPAKYRRTTLPLQRQPVDESVEPGEQSLNAQGLWRRSQDNWFLGAGQEYLDNRFAFVSVYTVSGETPSVRTRFWRSKGVNVWNEGALSLLPVTEQKVASTNTNLRVLLVDGGAAYVDGTELYWVGAPLANDWTSAYADPVAAGIQAGQSPATTVSSVTTDGYYVYAALGANGITKAASGASSSSVLTAGGTYAATLVGYANGHLIASTGKDLVEISAAGAKTDIWAGPTAPDFVWDGIRPGPNGIYCFGHSGSGSEVYVMTVNPSTGALQQPYPACSVASGEVVNDLLYYDGIVILATSLGVRACSAPDTSTGVFQTGTAIVGLGASECLAGFAEFVWFGTSNYSTADDITPGPGVTTSGLGRIDPRQFTSDSVPAWALDVQTPDGTGGTVGSAIAVAGAEGPLYNVPGALFFAIPGTGIFGQDEGNVVASGALETGWVRYGTTEPKVLVYLDERHAALPAEGIVALTAYKEDGTALSTFEATATGSLGPPAQWWVGLVVGEQFMVQATLTAGGQPAVIEHGYSPVDTLNVTMRRWTAKAQVLAPRQDEIIVPIRLRTRVDSNRGEGDPIYFDTLEEYLYLQNLARTGAIVPYQEGGQAFPVYVDQIELGDPETKWRDDYKFFETTCTLRLVTLV